MLDNKFFEDVAPKVVSRYRAFIFGTKSNGKSAKQVDGRPYPNYTDGGKSKRKGTGKLQMERYADSKAPVYTGKLMRDFQGIQTTKDGFKFGTPTRGDVVKHLANDNRVITTKEKPIPDKVYKYLIEQADEYITNKLNDIKGWSI